MPTHTQYCSGVGRAESGVGFWWRGAASLPPHQLGVSGGRPPTTCYASVPIGGGIKRCFCLTSVCLLVAYIRPNSRTERSRKTETGTEVAVAHVTRDSDTTFKVKVQLVTDVLNSQHAGTGATWQINAKILSTCRSGAILCCHAHSLFESISRKS